MKKLLEDLNSLTISQLSIYQTQLPKETLYVFYDTKDVSTENKIQHIFSQHTIELPDRVLFLDINNVNECSDVFAVTFYMLKYHSEHLAGSPIVEKVTLDKEHLRFRLEQELRNLDLRLRKVLMEELDLNNSPLIANLVREVKVVELIMSGDYFNNHDIYSNTHFLNGLDPIKPIPNNVLKTILNELNTLILLIDKLPI